MIRKSHDQPPQQPADEQHEKQHAKTEPEASKLEWLPLEALDLPQNFIAAAGQPVGWTERAAALLTTVRIVSHSRVWLSDRTTSTPPGAT